jgi:hypothetical protein
MGDCGGRVDVLEGEELLVLCDDLRVPSVLALQDLAEFAEVAFLGHGEQFIIEK